MAKEEKQANGDDRNIEEGGEFSLEEFEENSDGSSEESKVPAKILKWRVSSWV